MWRSSAVELQRLGRGRWAKALRPATSSTQLNRLMLPSSAMPERKPCQRVRDANLVGDALRRDAEFKARCTGKTLVPLGKVQPREFFMGTLLLAEPGLAVEPPPPVFGTDGIRGRVGVELTPSLALQLGYSCGHVLDQGPPVLLGRDSRKSSPMLVAALQAGLLAAGREVWDLGLCPTPTVAWLTRHQQAAGGLMISASHNPPADNGIKVFAQDGCKLPHHQQRDLEQWLKRSVPLGCHAGGSSHQRHDLLKVYEQGLLEQLEPGQGRRLRVILDLCWGAATACAVSLFERFGAEVTILHGQPDGNRINVGCGSTALDLLQQAVVDQEADLGIAFDGDADRCLAVDHRGQPVNGDHILYLWGGMLDDRGWLPGAPSGDHPNGQPGLSLGLDGAGRSSGRDPGGGPAYLRRHATHWRSAGW